jgi:hypothetical protein
LVSKRNILFENAKTYGSDLLELNQHEAVEQTLVEQQEKKIIQKN